MSDLATLLQAFAALLWPIFAFTALLVFRAQIADLAKRLKKGKLLGQEIELNEALDRLDRSAASIEQEFAVLPVLVSDAQTKEEQVAEESAVRNILSEAARSPKAALILLASELEKLARQILASTGHLQGRRFVPVQQAFSILDQKFGLPRHIPSSLKFFWEARNRLIHGGEGTNEDILRAIDSGLTILKALQAMPREVNVVYDPAATVYVDSNLTTPMPNVKGVILETLSPGGASKTLRIFPTTRTHFRKGHQVAWEWDMHNTFGPAWYRDPVTGEHKEAWSSSAEFIGRPLEEV